MINLLLRVINDNDIRSFRESFELFGEFSHLFANNIVLPTKK